MARNCLSEYLQNKIKISDVMAITCPFDGCKTLIESKEIEKLVEEAIYKKYLRFRLMKELEHDDSVRWCIRPGCEKYMKGNFMSTIVTCECG
jgi:E3 ubiquitin-protein ligase RNF19A